MKETCLSKKGWNVSLLKLQVEFERVQRNTPVTSQSLGKFGEKLYTVQWLGELCSG